MIQEIGKVIEVFIPNQYKNGHLLDVMDRTNIGFKIMTDRGIEEVITDADEFSSKIMKNDTVIITKQTISGKEFTDIELYEGEENE